MCVQIFRSFNQTMYWLIFTMLHYLTCMTKSEMLFSFGNIFWAMVCVYGENDLIISSFCFGLNATLAWSVYTEGFQSFILFFFPFLDTNHFLRLTITHTCILSDLNGSHSLIDVTSIVITHCKRCVICCLYIVYNCKTDNSIKWNKNPFEDL